MLVLMLAIGSSLLLFGCGGGSDSGNGVASSADGVISGTAVKGPVNGATVTGVCHWQWNNGCPDRNRNYERSGELCRVHRLLLGSRHAEDERREHSMSGGMTLANIAAANTAMGNYISVNDILYTHPMNPLTLGSGSGAT
jgi:hypothetical protein